MTSNQIVESPAHAALAAFACTVLPLTSFALTVAPTSRPAEERARQSALFAEIAAAGQRNCALRR